MISTFPSVTTAAERSIPNLKNTVQCANKRSRNLRTLNLIRSLSFLNFRQKALVENTGHPAMSFERTSVDADAHEGTCALGHSISEWHLLFRTHGRAMGERCDERLHSQPRLSNVGSCETSHVSRFGVLCCTLSHTHSKKEARSPGPGPNHTGRARVYTSHRARGHGRASPQPATERRRHSHTKLCQIPKVVR